MVEITDDQKILALSREFQKLLKSLKNRRKLNFIVPNHPTNPVINHLSTSSDKFEMNFTKSRSRRQYFFAESQDEIFVLFRGEKQTLRRQRLTSTIFFDTFSNRIVRVKLRDNRDVSAIQVAKVTPNFVDADLLSFVDQIFALRASFRTEEDYVEDIIEISTPSQKYTSRRTLILARLGQGKFRKGVMEKWKGCAVTGTTFERALRASHIKPWRDSDNRERLDPNNGLLLIPNLDQLFDLGVISFRNDGRILISDKCDMNALKSFGVRRDMRLRRKLNDIQKSYLRFHRIRWGFPAQSGKRSSSVRR